MTNQVELVAPVAVFGDPDSDLWAVLIGGDQPRLALAPVDAAGPGNPDAVQATFVTVELDPDDGEVWSLSGDNVRLNIEFAGASTYTHEDGSALQPCRLTGSAPLAGSIVEMDIPGVLLPELPTGKIDSIRIVGSWFPAGHEISLLSVRPKGAKGHDDDMVDVVGRGEAQTLFFDPRLSTTYGPSGEPRKAGIELWLGDDEDGDQLPRRVSGVASGASASSDLSGFTVAAHALHCLSRGEEGSGVYVLMRAA